MAKKKLTESDVRAKLRRLIKNRGHLAEIARLLGVNPRFVGHILAGRKKPSGKVLKLFGLRRVVSIHYEYERRKS